MFEIGTSLREARLRQGIDLPRVEADTKIRAKYLRALEEERMELAEHPPAPTIFVRRGARPGGLAPAETRTRFSWSIAETAA